MLHNFLVLTFFIVLFISAIIVIIVVHRCISYIPQRGLNLRINFVIVIVIVSWHEHTTLLTAHHKHTTLSPHRKCERTLHSLIIVHWWPHRTTNSRCQKQFRPYNTKPRHTNQSPKHHTTKSSSPDTTTVSNTRYLRTSWTTQYTLSSDHLPIIITINIRHDYRLQQNWRSFTNYKKVNWIQFSDDRESVFAQPPYSPTYILPI